MTLGDDHERRIQMLEADLRSHVQACTEASVEAKHDRYRLAAETQAMMSEIEAELRAGFKELHKRISDSRSWATGQAFAVAGAVITLLVGIVGFLVVKQLGW